MTADSGKPFVGIAFGGKRERLLLKTGNAAVKPCTMVYLTLRSMRSNASRHAHSCNDTIVWYKIALRVYVHSLRTTTVTSPHPVPAYNMKTSKEAMSEAKAKVLSAQAD